MELPSAPRELNSANKKNRTIGDKNSGLSPAEGEFSPAALPPDFRAEFENAVRTQKVNLPTFVAELRESGSLRGESSGQKSVSLSPNAQAVKNTRPTFSWQKFAAAGASYVVTIYDKDFNQIAVSPNLQTTKWQSDANLERGKIYKWQVKIDASADSYAAQFKVLDGNAVDRLKSIENAAPNFPLALGIAYASAGLLNEAEREFQKAFKNDPRGSLARKLKDSLFQNRKRR